MSFQGEWCRFKLFFLYYFCVGVRVRVNKRPSEISSANPLASDAINWMERTARMCFAARRSRARRFDAGLGKAFLDVYVPGSRTYAVLGGLYTRKYVSEAGIMAPSFYENDSAMLKLVNCCFFHLPSFCFWEASLASLWTRRLKGMMLRV